MDTKKRCSWCLKDDIYKDYHDNLWGIPEYNDQKLFEFLNLEGAQAGLSWYTILIRIENYRKAFRNWNVDRILEMNEDDLQELRNDPGIIRNKLKIHAVYTNAQAFQKMKEAGENFSDYLWSFVDGKPIVNDFKKLSEIPAQTELSVTLSKDLKKRGFKFVGPTIVYAFMQAVGMVDDHVVTCWRRQ